MTIEYAKLRSVTARQLVAALQADGFDLQRQKGSHRHYRQPDGRRGPSPSTILPTHSARVHCEASLKSRPAGLRTICTASIYSASCSGNYPRPPGACPERSRGLRLSARVPGAQGAVKVSRCRGSPKSPATAGSRFPATFAALWACSPETRNFLRVTKKGFVSGR
jgi:predicted RNA binding protein YcfA (HicA-like mRNA interferase family)